MLRCILAYGLADIVVGTIQIPYKFIQVTEWLEEYDKILV